MEKTFYANISKKEAWFNAFRPKTLTASFAPIPAATALAYADGGTIGWTVPIFALLSAICIQTGMHLVNDALDFNKGADTKERTGPVRLVQTGILSSKQVFMMGLAFLLLALVCGIPLILKGGLPILLILMVCCGCGYIYTGGPFPLSYMGLSDLFCVAFYGVAFTGSIYYLQTGQWTLNALIAGLQIGMMTTIMLAVNNLRDIYNDAKVNKRTLAVRFGKTFSRIEITCLVVLPLLLGCYWIFQGNWLAALLPLLVLPLAIKLLKSIWTTEPSPQYNKFLAMGSLVHLSFSLLLALAFVFSA